MKMPPTIPCASLAALSLLAGCSSYSTKPMLPTPEQNAAAPAGYLGLKDLYVADYDTGKIFLFKNNGFEPDGSITSGISGPWDITLDRLGNLYVANAAGGNITEYAPGASNPSFTYSYGMISPRLVSVDQHGNVFETDFTDYEHKGQVSEFSQGSNFPIYSCSLFAPWGVATDASGDVFVDYNASQGGDGHIAEFKGGLAGCSPIQLGAHVEKATGIVLDRRRDILIGDFSKGRVDVIPPPYSTIASHLDTGGDGPTFISIDRTNERVFASTPSSYGNHVMVWDYASGKVVDRLGGGRRLNSAYGVVDAQNAVP
jgi:DNA-binding beta-propeller fold protein YncE